MKKHFFRLFAVCLIALLVLGFSACKDNQKEPAEPATMVMDTTISQQAYLSELVDPAAATTPAAPEERPSPTQPGKPVNGMFFDDAVFVGDSVSLKLNYYVSDQRSYGDCLGKAKFLTSGSLGSAMALEAVSSESLHPTYQGQKLRLLRQQENSLPLNQLGSFSGILDGIILLFTPLLIKTKGSISKH